MKFFYISPSVIPSRTANATHVIMQCDALSQLGTEVTLYANRSVSDRDKIKSIICNKYNIMLKNVELVTYYSRFNAAVNFRIAFMSIFNILKNSSSKTIFSRNLYAAFFLGVLLKKPIIFETHQLEIGIRKLLQKSILVKKNIITIVISKKLRFFLENHHKIRLSAVEVLHDAAPDGLMPIKTNLRRSLLLKIIPEVSTSWKGVCGYFGHLYQGRGIEIIEAIADVMPDVLFIICGGNDKDIQQRKSNNRLKNLIYVGYLPYAKAQEIMKVVDVLLMPYQKNVSIGVRGHNTADWMSPMKMFEYMASGVPMISSDLPVLREVLQNGENALLVAPDDVNSWMHAVDTLLSDPELGQSLSFAAYNDYKNHYTWTKRATKILNLAERLGS